MNLLIIRNSGNIKEKVYTLFGDTKSDKYKDFLCLLITYHSLPTDSISKWYTLLKKKISNIHHYHNKKRRMQ
jgi:hypothetical protein